MKMHLGCEKTFNFIKCQNTQKCNRTTTTGLVIRKKIIDLTPH